MRSTKPGSRIAQEALGLLRQPGAGHRRGKEPGEGKRPCTALICTGGPVYRLEGSSSWCVRRAFKRIWQRQWLLARSRCIAILKRQRLNSLLTNRAAKPGLAGPRREGAAINTTQKRRQSVNRQRGSLSAHVLNTAQSASSHATPAPRCAHTEAHGKSMHCKP